MNFADIRAEFGSHPSFPPDLTPPSAKYFRRLQKKFARTFPPAFITFQTLELFTTPMSARDWDGFGWASPGLEPYMSLYSLLKDAEYHKLAPHLLPFRSDEGNLYCLDTSHPTSTGDSPIVFWDHDEQGILDVPHYQWPGFIEWLYDGLLKERQSRH